jgi:hypothetical protein
VEEQVPVAHACDPSYSGSRDLKDCGLKSAWEKGSPDAILKKPIIKKTDRVAQGEGPEFKLQYSK